MVKCIPNKEYSDKERFCRCIMLKRLLILNFLSVAHILTKIQAFIQLNVVKYDSFKNIRKITSAHGLNQSQCQSSYSYLPY